MAFPPKAAQMLDQCRVRHVNTRLLPVPVLHDEFSFSHHTVAEYFVGRYSVDRDLASGRLENDLESYYEGRVLSVLWVHVLMFTLRE